MEFISNPLAPPGFDGINANTADYLSVAGFYPFERVVGSLENATGLVAQIDRDSDFICHAFQIVGYTSVNFTILLYDNYSKKYFNQPIQAAAFLNGGVGVPVPLPPGIKFPAGSFIGIDLADQSGDPNTIQLLFMGERIYKNYQ